MARTITFTYENTDYTLEFTRKTIEKMEADGIVLSDLQDKYVTMIPLLFKYSFFAHHKRMSQEKIDEIYKLFKDKDKLIEALSQMVVDTINTLFEEPDEKNAISWKATI